LGRSKLSDPVRMRVAVWLCVAFLSAITAAGCGGVSAKKSRPEPPHMAVSIPILFGKHLLPKQYTCDGGDISPPIRWNGVPSGTVELAMFVVGVSLVKGKYFFDWAVTGLKPTQHEIPAGTLPTGAIIGRNSYGKAGYSMCVSKGHYEENAIVDLVALTHPLTAKPGFDAEAVWNEALRAPVAEGREGWRYDRKAA
jgi:phosphatidylethanolamine-binding protein (PEBP) family uncharacterized protein